MLILIIIAVIIIAIVLINHNSKVINSEQELAKRCFGDIKKAERLIKFELSKNPKLSRNQAAKDAIQSIVRDN